MSTRCSPPHSLTHSLNPCSDVRTAGAICVGNIGRNESACVVLVSSHAHLLSKLIGLVDGKDSSNMHAALGTLKNLATPTPNKPILANTTLLPNLMHALHSPHTPIQYNACSITRSLCLSQQPQQVRAIATSHPDLVSVSCVW